jgi:hypothetical protein
MFDINKKKSIMSTTRNPTHKWLSINTVFLAAALIVSIVALVYAIKNRNEINDIEHSMATGTKSGFESGPRARDRLPDLVGPNKGSSDDPDNWFFGASDGNDTSNDLYSGSAQSQCKPAAVAEAYHPHASAASGAPRMVPSASTYSSAYADETASNSLAGKTTYSCAPDVATAGGCDYAINPDNLMPGSWREGVSCGDGTDPNSQWAKYHPTREKYNRYITAAGSARLGVMTRSPLRKILGTQNFLRSATSTPLSTTEASPFMASSHRDQAIFSAVGQYPQHF